MAEHRHQTTHQPHDSPDVLVSKRIQVPTSNEKQITNPTTEFQKGLLAREEPSSISKRFLMEKFMTLDLYNEPLRHEASIGISEGRIYDGQVPRRPPQVEMPVKTSFEPETSDSEGESIDGVDSEREFGGVGSASSYTDTPPIISYYLPGPNTSTGSEGTSVGTSKSFEKFD